MAEVSAVEGIVARAFSAMPALVGPVINRGVEGDMAAMTEVMERHVRPGEMRECLRAGLWVLADDLDRAHRICQEIETAHGAAWHAVVHRREGDFWNSKYWWRRAGGVKFGGLVGRVRAEVKETPPELAAWLRNDRYDAAGFVDLVERHAERADIRPALLAIQRLEWIALFQECWGG
ncbi:MAG TPA: hypothetical protein VHM90_15375 [Phycisphaerae bacterium]|nr:hypothetical protein [Phycisphaerae bacterium]